METDDRLQKLIARSVLVNSNYWGYLFSVVRRKPILNDSESNDFVMGVAPQNDGTIALLYDPSKIERTSDNDIMQILKHEGMHLLNQHIPRLLKIIADETNSFNKLNKSRIFNYAADAAVNDQANILDPIKVAGVEIVPVTPKSLGLPESKTTEWYYAELIKSSKKINMNIHLIGDHGKWDKIKSGISDLHAFSRRIEQYTANVVRESLKTFNRSRGSLPSYLEELIKNILEPPKVPYYQILRKLVVGSRYTKFKNSSFRINKKRAYTFFLESRNLPAILPFPGKKRDLTFSIVILIDTSGSMSNDDIAEALSGIKNIIENDKYCKTTVLEVDTEVKKEYEVKKISDIQHKVSGRGGTRLGPGLERARKLKCDVCLGFTDGATENINQYSRKQLPKKIVWVVPEGYSTSNLDRTGPVIRIPNDG